MLLAGGLLIAWWLPLLAVRAWVGADSTAWAMSASVPVSNVRVRVPEPLACDTDSM